MSWKAKNKAFSVSQVRLGLIIAFRRNLIEIWAQNTFFRNSSSLFRHLTTQDNALKY